MNHQFDIEHAKKYGIEAAIVIANLQFWILKNKANKRHIYEGRVWTYNSARAFAELFPYWSEKQIQRILKKMEDDGIIVTGNFNSSTYDRTKWYAFKDQSTFLNCPIHWTESGNGIAESVQSLTDSKQDIKPDKLFADEPAIDVSKLTTGVNCPHQEILKLFAKHLPNMPQPRIWKAKRAKDLSDRWKWVLTATREDGTPYATDRESALDFFDRFFAYVAKSDFLTGRNGVWTGCDLPWLVKEDKFANIISGKYENRG